MHRFVGIDLGRERAPIILRLRHLLEPHHLGKKLFEQVHWYLEAQGMKVARGILMIKNTFGFVAVCYKGLIKNANRLFATCALANSTWRGATCCGLKGEGVSNERKMARKGEHYQGETPKINSKS